MLYCTLCRVLTVITLSGIIGEYMRKNMYVIAMPYPNNTKLPDILEEDDGKIMYFKNKKEATNFLQNIYDERNFELKALVDDNVELMGVQ